jgi:hypothetical protein
MPQGQALLDPVGTAFARLRRRKLTEEGAVNRPPATASHVMLVCDVALLREEP